MDGQQKTAGVAGRWGLFRRVLPATVTRKHFWYWSIVVLAALAAIVLVLAQTLKPEDVQNSVTDKTSKNKIAHGLPAGYNFTVMDVFKNQYPSGFPKELVFFKDAKLVRGEDTTDGQGTHHRVVDFTTATPVKDSATQYQTKLSQLKWKQVFSQTQTNLVTMDFTKDQYWLSVIIFQKTASSSLVSLDAKTLK